MSPSQRDKRASLFLSAGCVAARPVAEPNYTWQAGPSASVLRPKAATTTTNNNNNIHHHHHRHHHDNNKSNTHTNTAIPGPVEGPPWKGASRPSPRAPSARAFRVGAPESRRDAKLNLSPSWPPPRRALPRPGHGRWPGAPLARLAPDVYTARR